MQAMARPVLTFLAIFACSATLLAQTATPAPTVEEARAFIERVNTALLASSIENSRTAWVGRTYITDDTEILIATASARTIALRNQLIAESHRFDNLKLPPDLAREIMLLRTNARPAPSDPALRLETTRLAAQLEGIYGKGKYCVGGDSRQCLGIDDLDVRMATSRDPKELLELWTGWHAIAVPMRPKYARFVELSNQGARELGFEDTGGSLALPLRHARPTVFGRARAHVAAATAAVRRIACIRALQTRSRSMAPRADRPDGMIPAHLLGNMWAQEWGNIYDIVAPASAPAHLRPRSRAPAADSQREQLSTHDAANSRQPKLWPATASLLYLAWSGGVARHVFERSQFIRPRDRDVDCHASAWDIDADQDLRIKMCIHIDADDFTTVHHEEGHNIYQRAYSNQPFLFRNGANDGFHEAIGDSIALVHHPRVPQATRPHRHHSAARGRHPTPAPNRPG